MGGFLGGTSGMSVTIGVTDCSFTGSIVNFVREACTFSLGLPDVATFEVKMSVQTDVCVASGFKNLTVCDGPHSARFYL